MRSTLPKVLQPLCGVPMIQHVVDAVRPLDPDIVAVVVGHEGGAVRAALQHNAGLTFVEQPEQRGTGDAVVRAMGALGGCGRILVLNGDEPLVETDTLRRLLSELVDAPVAFAVEHVADAGRLGRVRRDRTGAVAAVAQAPAGGLAGPAEINWGQYAFDGGWLAERAGSIPLSPAGEYYLTHLIAVAYQSGRAARTVALAAGTGLGIDDKVKLAEGERRMRWRVLERHMLAGVTIVDPATTYIDATVTLMADVTVHPNSYLYGQTTIGAGSTVGPGATLRNATIGAGSRVEASLIEDSAVGDRCSVGPFAHLRQGAVIGDDCRLGNYAEVKNSVIGRGCDMHHFSYVGDAVVGEETNIAAGVITCNFDGVNKNRTVLGSRVLLGSDTMLVAPVSVGDGAITGAGSVVTRDIPAGEKWAGVPARPMESRTGTPEADAARAKPKKKKPKP